jgi:hypothetical protein
MDRREFEIDVEGSTDSESEIYTIELEGVILNASRDVEVSRIKRDQSTMDLGATIGVVIMSAAATTLAHGIADWLRKRPGAKIRIKDGLQEIEMGGMSGKDTARILEILTGKA